MDAAVDGLASQKKAVDDIVLYAKDFKEHVGKVKEYCNVFEIVEFRQENQNSIVLNLNSSMLSTL